MAINPSSKQPVQPHELELSDANYDSLLSPFKNLNGPYNSSKNANNQSNVKTDKINKSIKNLLASNGLFSITDANWYDTYNRYGWIDPYDHDKYREFLFFTKPDMNIFNTNKSKDINSADLVAGESDNNLSQGNLKQNPIITEAYNNHIKALAQLQSSIKDSNGNYNPFMYLLSNSCNSKLDLPGISSESQSSTTNIMGTEIMYRGHSLKSDNGYDFTLSFTDTQYMEIYYMLKSYDEIMRLYKTGEHRPKFDYITNNIVDYMFSIYKFLVGSDGETIAYFAKLTGVYFTDVPRGDMSDPGDDGLKYSISFHANFIEDSNPAILAEFNALIPYDVRQKSKTYIPVFNPEIGAVDNTWAQFPIVTKKSNSDGAYWRRVGRRNNRKYDYYLKWI